MVSVEKKNILRHLAVRWLGHKGRKQLRPWYFLFLALLMWAPLGGVPLDNFVLGLRIDHLLHASVFIPCSLFIYDLYKRKWAVWPTAVAIGVLTESVQALLPYRGFDINDMVANFLGVSLGWMIILTIKYKHQKRTL
jgi:glycopeptide antibiotics resistance protein